MFLKNRIFSARMVQSVESAWTVLYQPCMIIMLRILQVKRKEKGGKEV